MAIFTVLSSWQSHCESSLGSYNDYRTAPGGSRPLDQANQLESQARLYRQPVTISSIHHHHLLSLLIPKADTHYTVPRRVKGSESTSYMHTRRNLAKIQPPNKLAPKQSSIHFVLPVSSPYLFPSSVSNFHT